MKRITLAILLSLFVLSGNAWAVEKLVIAEIAAAKTGDILLDSSKIPATCHITGTIAGVEAITIQTRGSDGTTWKSIKEGGTTLVLNVNTTIYGVYAPGTYRFSKSITAAAAGVICTY